MRQVEPCLKKSRHEQFGSFAALIEVMCNSISTHLLKELKTQAQLIDVFEKKKGLIDKRAKPNLELLVKISICLHLWLHKCVDGLQSIEILTEKAF